MAYVVLAHNTNEDGWESANIFNTVFKTIDSAKEAIIEEASYMVEEGEEPPLEWVEEHQALAYDGTILYRIEKVEIEQ